MNEDLPTLFLPSLALSLQQKRLLCSGAIHLQTLCMHQWKGSHWWPQKLPAPDIELTLELRERCILCHSPCQCTWECRLRHPM